MMSSLLEPRKLLAKDNRSNRDRDVLVHWRSGHDRRNHSRSDDIGHRGYGGHQHHQPRQATGVGVIAGTGGTAGDGAGGGRVDRAIKV